MNQSESSSGDDGDESWEGSLNDESSSESFPFSEEGIFNPSPKFLIFVISMNISRGKLMKSFAKDIRYFLIRSYQINCAQKYDYLRKLLRKLCSLLII